MHWKIAEAKRNFSKLVKAAEDEPQWIYNRDKLVAAVVPAETLKAFLGWRQQQEGRTLAEAFAELRRICEEEDYTLEIPPRQEPALDEWLNGLSRLTSVSLPAPAAEAFREEDDGGPEVHEVVREATRRDEELTSGKVEGRSHEQVMESARRALRHD